VGLLLNYLLQHFPAKRLEGEVSVESKLEKIRLQKIAIKGTRPATKVKYAAFKCIPAWVKNCDTKSI